MTTILESVSREWAALYDGYRMLNELQVRSRQQTWYELPRFKRAHIDEFLRSVRGISWLYHSPYVAFDDYEFDSLVVASRQRLADLGVSVEKVLQQIATLGARVRNPHIYPAKESRLQSLRKELWARMDERDQLRAKHDELSREMLLLNDAHWAIRTPFSVTPAYKEICKTARLQLSPRIASAMQTSRPKPQVTVRHYYEGASLVTRRWRK